MKVVCIGVILCLCLASTLAWRGNPKQEDDEREFIDKFLQFSAATNGKFISYNFIYCISLKSHCSDSLFQVCNNPCTACR